MLYKSWPGKSKFICRGRLMLGADWLRAVFTSLLILLCHLYTLIFPCTYFGEEGSYVSFVLILLLGIFPQYFLCRASTSDPGYIPQQIHPFAGQGAVDLNDYIVGPRPFKVQHLGGLAKLKFCKTCMIFRPPRTSHCSVCGVCVEVFDHHCPWIGNCVGRRNYVVFLKFLISLAVFLPANFTVIVFYVCATLGNNTWAIVGIAAAGLLGIISILIWILLTFHLATAGMNVTTYEKIKNAHEIKAFNLYSRSNCFGNLHKRCMPGVRQFYTGKYKQAAVVDPNAIHRNFKVIVQNSFVDKDESEDRDKEDSEDKDKEEASLLKVNRVKQPKDVRTVFV